MERGEDNFGYYSATGAFVEAPRKQVVRIQIPYTFRFSLIWTIFFAIIGIVIQAISADFFVFGDSLKAFFITNFADWFRSFGNFSDTTLYPTAMDFLSSLLRQWYYFCYTGGLIALVWSILSWIMHGEIVIKKKEKPVQARLYAPAEEAKPESMKEVEALLLKGENLVLLGKKEEAKSIYEEIKKKYNPDEDEGRKFYRKILDFYSEIE